METAVRLVAERTDIEYYSIEAVQRKNHVED